MTETEIRQKVAATARAWLGAVQGDARHKQIIDIYNNYSPKNRGYKMTYTDAWCAAFTSAVGIQLGYADIIPPECSCGYMIDLFRKSAVSRWEENDAFVPQPGDIVMYYWADGTDFATTDQQGWPDHVGIVTAVNSSALTIVEGNNSKAVRERSLQVNGRYIRGYCLPAYWIKAEATPEATPLGDASEGKPDEGAKPAIIRYDTLAQMPSWARPEIMRLCDAGAIGGNTSKKDEDGYPADMDLSLDMLRMLVIVGRAMKGGA